MSSQYGELRPTSGWDRFTSLGHPCKFQRLSRLGSVTARQSSSEYQPNFEALNRGRHLYSAGRPSRWALAHISSYWRKMLEPNLVVSSQKVQIYGVRKCGPSAYAVVASIFTARRYAGAVWPCVCPSVCPFVTSRNCIETARRIELVLA